MRITSLAVDHTIPLRFFTLDLSTRSLVGRRAQGRHALIRGRRVFWVVGLHCRLGRRARGYSRGEVLLHGLVRVRGSVAMPGVGGSSSAGGLLRAGRPVPVAGVGHALGVVAGRRRPAGGMGMCHLGVVLFVQDFICVVLFEAVCRREMSTYYTRKMYI